MREITQNWLAAFVVVLSPIIPLVILVFIASLLDAITFRMALKKTDGKVSSKKFWKGILLKTVIYTIAIGGVFTIELTLGNHLLDYFEAEKWSLLPTRIAATLIVWHEVKSIDKNYTIARGVSFIKKIKEYIKGFFEIKKEIKDNMD